MLTTFDMKALRAMTDVPADYPRIAAECATRIASATDPKRAACLASVEEVHAMALVAHALLAPAFRPRRG